MTLGFQPLTKVFLKSVNPSVVFKMYNRFKINAYVFVKMRVNQLLIPVQVSVPLIMNPATHHVLNYDKRR